MSAVFDDRIEITSSGLLPPGITVEMLSGPHLSKLRNPKIADAFHRIGAIEAWGRGTNRVIEECEKYGIESPTFQEEAEMVVVTFRVKIGPDKKTGPESGPESEPESRPESLEDRILTLLSSGPLSKAELAKGLGHQEISGALNRNIRRLLSDGIITYTVPDKPTSNLQKYRLVKK